MKKMLKYFLLSIMFFLGFHIYYLHAQEAIIATGGNARGSSGSVSYSIGQVLYIPIPGTTTSVAPGVQQPYEISVVTGIEETEGIELMISVYPNPAIDFLMLRIEPDKLINSGSVCYRFYDMHGKLAIHKNIVSDYTSIPMENLAPGIYFLKIMDSDGEVGQRVIKTFKIIKTK